MSHCRPRNALTAKTLAEAIAVASYQFDEYNGASGDEYAGLEFVTILDAPEALHQALEQGEIVGHAVTLARDLCNTPTNDMFPEDLAREAERIAENFGSKVTNKTFDPMGSLVRTHDDLGLVRGVHLGSDSKAAFIVLEYRGNPNKGHMDLVAIGKGVMFDTGGLSIKSADGMLGMKHDMGGGAATLAGFEAIVRLELPINMVAIVPAVENSVSGRATRPGDVLTSMGGTTVEVLNTDAEGRLILADALEYAAKFYPHAAMYFTEATLTGAAGMALGSSYSAVFGDNDQAVQLVQRCSDEVADPVWRLPLGKEFDQKLKSHIADIANVQSGASKKGGASIGAAFLFYFARKAGISSNYVHADIAPRTTDENGLSLGAGTWLLIQIALELAKKAK